MAYASCVALALLCLPASTSAQNAQQRQAAASAFDRGTTAYLQEDFATAARYFEMANDLAPAAGALMQAIIAHQRAGNDLRAASLSLRLVARFPDDADMVGRAQGVLDELSERFLRVDVDCDAECAVEVDGVLSSHDSFFVDPDAEHRIGATFDTGTVEETVQGAAGEVRTLTFEAPEGAVRLEGPEAEGDTTTTAPNPLEGADEPTATPEESGGISPAFFITSLVLTAGAGAALVWSGLDTLKANDEYEAAIDEGDFVSAQQMYDDGQDLELRTNILIGATAGLAALTVVFAIVTDWGGSDDDDVALTLRPQIALGAKDRVGGLVMEGTF
ncbi:MAG: hypothetical protein CMN30_21205 [Sandaracinus sp.]|nr:hypothetical protein [Sandaracinus sp.]